MSITYLAGCEAQTCKLAALLARKCVMGDCLLLYGEVGAGKTAFARGFIRALSNEAMEITSPTFTLVQTYALPQNTVWHYDLYRLKTSKELEELGLAEALETGITLIEWPEIAEKEAPDAALKIVLRAGACAHERAITLACVTARWSETLRGIKDQTA